MQRRINNTNNKKIQSPIILLYFNYLKSDIQWPKPKRYTCFCPVNIGNKRKHEEQLVLVGGAKTL